MATQKETVDLHSELLREHVKQLATLVERIDGVRADNARIEHQIRDVADRVRDLEVKLTTTARDAERLAERLDERTSRRFQFSMVLVAAVLAALLGFAGDVGLRSLEQEFSTTHAPAVLPRGR